MIAPTSFAMDYNLSGYLTFGVGRMAHEGPTYIDYDTSYNYDMESKIALQLDVSIFRKLQFTTQILARGNTASHYDEYRPQVEWAFLSYRFAPQWNVRIGRLRIPYYLISDSRDLGYTHPWVRPPVDVYSNNLEFLNNFDGVELLYDTKWNNLDIAVQLTAGSYAKENNVSEFRAKFTGGMAVTFSSETITFRLHHTEATVDLHANGSEPLVSAFREIGEDFPVFNYLIDRALIDNERFIYDTLGIIFDDGQWIIHSEIYRIETDHDTAVNYSAAYLSVGYQFGNVTPYITTGRSEAEGGAPMKTRIENTYSLDIPVEQRAYVDFVRQEVINATSKYKKQHTLSIGVRWDFMDSTALKFEALQFKPKDSICGALECQGGRSKNAILYSMVIDMIF